MSDSKFLSKLKSRWGLQSGFQVLIILIVFALTGFSIVYLKKWIFWLFGFDGSSKGWWGTVAYLVLVFPLYQVLLLVYGFIFGQFHFFWEKEKKLLGLIRRLFRKRKTEWQNEENH